MKRFLMWCVMKVCYGFGHAISCVMMNLDWARLYPAYNWLMLKSHDIDAEYCFGEWVPETKEWT